MITKKVTSTTLQLTPEGQRMSIAYAVIGEGGKIIESNKRINRVITDETALALIKEVDNIAQSLVDQEG